MHCPNTRSRLRQPDEADAERAGGEAAGAQQPWCALEHVRHDAAHALGKERVERSFDREGEPQRGEQIRHPLRTRRSEEHTSELQSLMRISYAVFCLKKKKKQRQRKP